MMIDFELVQEQCNPVMAEGAVEYLQRHIPVKMKSDQKKIYNYVSC